MKGNITIKEAARLMNKCEQFVRIGLQNGILPIGTAIKRDGSSKYSYHISPKLFNEYLGIEVNENCTNDEKQYKIE